jgi:RNA polymerase sigma factor (sigma-70 family)
VPNQDTTTELVRQAQRGEAAAFAALAREFLRPAYTVALAILGRPSDAEDAAQEALIVALERIESCREPDRFRGWMFQIVRNHSKTWLTRRKHRDVAAAADPAEPAHNGPGPDAGALRGHLLTALQQLGAVQREVVLLHDLEGWTHPEIADALTISVVMSRQHLFQARKKLQKAFESVANGARV